MIRVVCV